MTYSTQIVPHDLTIIDTHAHLDMPEFEVDRNEVIERAHSKGVKTIITIGINAQSNLQAIALAEKHPGVLAGIGIHPQDSRGITRQDIEVLRGQAVHPRVVGIGETGLDFYRNLAPEEDQIRALTWQLEIARETDLPVIIHSRQAQAKIFPVLESWARSTKRSDRHPVGVIHCFQLDLEVAHKYIELGFFLSVGAYVSYPSSAKFREILKEIPLDKLLIETDCPFLPPQQHRGKRNEPAYTLFTAETIAGIKQVPVDEISEITTRNARLLFYKGFPQS